MCFFGKTLALTIGILTVMLSGTAVAHHGWTGVIAEKHFGNPHDRLTIEAEGQMWNIVLSTPSRSRRANFGNNNVSVGDEVTAFGHRHADGTTLEMKTERLKVGEILFDLYPNRN